MYSKVQEILKGMYGLAITEMAIMEPSELGSIDQAVTTSDGVWLTRCHFSQNHTFTVRNYMNNYLEYFVHLCMRGSKNDPVDDNLYKGTAKSAEGHAANVAFGLAKEDGMNIEVNWQDADSSSAN